VPPGAIDVQPDRVAAQPSVELLERLQEARPVTPWHPDHAAPTEQWRHPAAEVEARVVLAGCGDPEAFAAFAPAPAQAGMEGEAGLIREGDGVVGAERLEFFFSRRGNARASLARAWR
jgi:hypothetical protein